MKKENKFNELVVFVRDKARVWYSLGLFYLMMFMSEVAFADPRGDAKEKLQSEGKNIFVAVADVAKYLAPFVTAFALVTVFVAGQMSTDDNGTAKTKKQAKVILILGACVTLASWITSLVTNKTV